MANDFSQEQLRLIALAQAEMAADKGEIPVEWVDVIKQAPVKAIAGFADQIINTPENIVGLLKAAYGAGAIATGLIAPEDAPKVELPPNRFTDYLDKNNVIDKDMAANMTPAQRVADVGIQSALLGTVAPAAGVRQIATNSALAAGSGMAGQAVTEATGSELAGLATSVVTGAGSPMAANRVAAINRARQEAMAINAVRDKTLQEARNIGFIVVPDNRVADFADRPKLLEAAVSANNKVTNRVAARSLGLSETTAIDDKVLGTLRNQAYNTGYVPLKQLGRFPSDMDYFNDLIAIESKYSGAKGSFPKDVPKKLTKLINDYAVPDFDSADIVDKVRQLRSRATKYINSTDPAYEELGYAYKEVANSLEAQLEREVMKRGLPPNLLENYKAARRQIAISHTVEDTLERGSGQVDMNKLARAFQRGDYMEGELKSAAAFANVHKPRAGSNDKKTEYGHYLGLAAGYSAAQAMDLPTAAGAALAFGGALAAGAGKNALSERVRDYLMSPAGQRRSRPNYDEFGPGALSALAPALASYNNMNNQP